MKFPTFTNSFKTWRKMDTIESYCKSFLTNNFHPLGMLEINEQFHEKEFQKIIYVAEVIKTNSDTKLRKTF